jgi:hypothetical protein
VKTTISLTVTPPPPVPVVTVNSPAPYPADTGQPVTVTFTVASTSTVTGITVNWGDGTTNSLAGTLRSDTHTYTSTGSVASKMFTIIVTATNMTGPGSGTTTETVNDRPPTVMVSNVSPNPATTGQLVAVTFSATDPDGTISYFTVTWGDSTTPDTRAATATSDTHTYTAAGPFTITVKATDNSGSTGQNSFVITVTQAISTVTITTTLSQTSITVGGSVTDAASLSGNTPTAGGSVTYNFFTGSTCSGTGTPVGTPASVTNGVVPNSASQTFNTVGSFSWIAVYGGDTRNSPATSPCEPLTVNLATPSLSTILSATTITAGQSVSDSATLTNSFQAGGTVTYNSFSTSDCSGTSTVVSKVVVTNNAVPASGSDTFNTAGGFSLNAIYSGDGNNNGATSTCESLSVGNPNQAATLTSPLSLAGIAVAIILIVAGLIFVRNRGKKPTV